MKKVLLPILFLGVAAIAQKSEISQKEVTRIETVLASDEMEGRKVFEPGIEKASQFIESEFKNIGLRFYGDLKTYRQEFAIKGKPANNVIAVIPGKSKADEFVVFSAHYDHLGVKGSGDDRIFNGANDDASGVTAVIALAKHYKQKGGNERTLVFVAFTAEEIGGFGSRHFSESINPDKVVAMFNIEMIGTESKWGKNSAYITGFEKSDFGKILQKNLKGSKFRFEPDPYPEMKLFYRSDNATLAALGVPAHTISTSKMDDEPNYHKASDEVGTLDMANMTEIIKSIAVSAESIISGKETPTRVEVIR
ncbi:M28 family metallopeptidase [Flavobacterium selenitireducens]|uniref:M28 family metallopeptidase n=1 Tax=Flavobacterium selenitireducens TaxID=2722704 RepID=UPI00168B7F65|nr:M20/M25/M40 family metallo-hydrolase [Flavobacterium selenitireducens]MBD3583203.1 M20/M25/M40 family metallo-hydrolase [Flavobacterium selenitireducens]